ncbi:MAG: sigma-70 family RNA polymerase sigma factor [Candidatus Poribacteria bacterium]|nr:sigma-70 family RNA polymerase sigma factor [Candidatus Poribacteria bacterium]
MERADDVQLIHRVLAGDDAAFDLLVKKYEKSAHALAWRKVGNFHDAEEITQDAFLQAYKKLATLKNPHQFAGWLYVIVNRLCIDWMRKQKPAMRSLEEMSVKAIDDVIYARYVEEHRESEATDRRHEIVKKLLEKLPESERTVVTLYYLGEMTMKEISKFLGVSVKTISSRLHRARKRLKEKEDIFVQEFLGGMQLSANVRPNIMRQIADINPTPTAAGKPLLPWAAFAATGILVILMLSISNQYLARFQRPYSFEAASEPTIEIIEAPIVLDTALKPAVRNQIGRTVASETHGAGLQVSEQDSTPNASEDSLSVSETHWMPDPALREAIREKLDMPSDVPLTQAYLQQHLTGLDVRDKGIADLTGVEHATDLQALVLIENKIHDISPLSGLTKLGFLDLGGNQISDLRPIAALTRLETLHIWRNEIEDISPLTGLVNLKKLSIENNDIKDFSPLDGLNHLEVVNIKGNFRVGDYIPRVAVAPRIKDRDYPSIFAAWAGNDILNLPNLSGDEAVIHHDLFWSGPGFHLQWHPTPEGLRLFGRIDDAHWKREYLLSQNPNFIRLVSLDYTDAELADYPEDWPYWIRDENGNRVRVYAGASDFLIDFTHPVVQDILVQKAVAVAKSGLYDGIFLGQWEEDQATLNNDKGVYYRSVEAEGSARISMVRRIREVVGDDFLIIVGTNQRPAPLSAPYVNGMFMEAILDAQDTGYTHAGLREIESVLLWSEQNFRDPQISALEGRGISLEPADSRRNRQTMRVITTLSLTHSDGYVCYNIGVKGIIHEHKYEIWPGHKREHIEGKSHLHNHQHYWYSFYDAPLGRPVGKKAQLYHNTNGHAVEGLFIREFTNGWAVYNRSGKEQNIRLPEQAIGVASGTTGVNHTLSDLDGEIYLK